MQQGANSPLILTSPVHFDSCDKAKTRHHICFMSTFDSVELCKGTMLFHPKLVAPTKRAINCDLDRNPPTTVAIRSSRLQSLMSVHHDNCLGTKAPVIAVSTAYKPGSNATRCKITTFEKIVGHKQRFHSTKAQPPLV